MTTVAGIEVMCIDTFKRWERSEPTKLLEAALDESLSPALRSEAAEYLGRCVETAIVPALMRLLQHPKSFLREGAVLGLSRIGEQAGPIAERLRIIALDDRSPGMRMTAQDAVEALAESGAGQR